MRQIRSILVRNNSNKSDQSVFENSSFIFSILIFPDLAGTSESERISNMDTGIMGMSVLIKWMFSLLSNFFIAVHIGWRPNS